MLKMFLSKRFLKTVGALVAVAAIIWMAGPPVGSSLNNSFAVLLIGIMIMLLIVIGVLAYILIGTADTSFIKWKKKNEESKKSAATRAAAIFVGLMVLSVSVSAKNSPAATQTTATIAGLSQASFYTVVAIIFLELVVVVSLLINIRLLSVKSKE